MIKIQQQLEKIRGVIPWSISIKLILSALISVLGGAGILGYLSEYATYNYAIHYGFRPPLEGIPYLRPAVAFGSLFLLSSGAIVFASIAFALRSLVWYLDAIPRLAGLPFRFLKANTNRQERKMGNFLFKARSMTLQQHVAISALCAMVAFVGIAVLDYAHKQSSQLISDPGFAAFVTAYIVAITFAVLRPNTIWWTAIIATVVYFIVCVYLLFSPVKYSQFLRILGYGGGISATIELREDKKETGVGMGVQQLMLRTTEAVILYDATNGTFNEIPRDQVRRIVHDVGGMSKLPHLLPVKVHRWGAD